jgi:RNA polymerase sigma-70 factor (ECF subfamily)
MMDASGTTDKADTWIAKDDLALAEQALTDRRAAEKVLVRVRPRVQYAIRVLMGNDRDREDVLSQTMLEILESIGNFKGKGSLEAWAGKIAFHTVTGHNKRRGMIERVMTPDTYDMGVAKTTPEQETARGRVRERITKALDKLPEERRRTLVLRLIFGHSIAEIATLTDVPVNTVRSRLRTGLRELRRGVAVERDYLLAK